MPTYSLLIAYLLPLTRSCGVRTWLPELNSATLDKRPCPININLTQQRNSLKNLSYSHKTVTRQSQNTLFKASELKLTEAKTTYVREEAMEGLLTEDRGGGQERTSTNINLV